MSILRFALLAGTGVSVACAAPGKDPAPEPAVEMVRVPVTVAGSEARTSVAASNVVTVTADMAKTWRAMPAAFDSLKVPITSVDPGPHTIGNGEMQLRRRLGAVPLREYLNCGYTQNVPNTETYDVHMSVMSRLTPAAAGGTTITTTVQAYARPISTSGESVRCSSTGNLEIRLGALVAGLVKSSS